MVKRMLIDATHPEETRVVVLDGNRLEEFDVEAASKKPLKSNIYLAKVTRVEPSLQAAFVDYGGNRHGFLPFSEIHPDYYRIPIADREALIAEEAKARANANGEAESLDQPEEAAAEEAEAKAANGEDREPGDSIVEVETENSVDTLDGDEAEDVARRRAQLLRKYKIQEVIKRGQVLLVQVTKEERGNKGAALTTYLSLAGRYCVLMPNTPRGGGISRKISSGQDRKRLKSVVSELEIPDGMAVIVRTAGSERTKAEIRRDYEYLLRLWSEIREQTLKSNAPALIYEEGDLIKRSLRDLYARDTEEILVEGDEAYKAAKNFMKQLTPSHARKVKQYKDERIPLLHRFQVENQLDAIHTPVVQLKSGGYIVLNQTEALVAIDVNSGRSTKERHIEETALKTNLEAADEVARQLRLRDLAGLVVVDFIDMDESRHNREVERRLKEAMKSDRARIQLGRISPFGLLELSRQRLRPSLVETSTEVCSHCGGSGRVRSVESTALMMLRLLEEEGIKRGKGQITLTVPTAVALFILNQKRDHLAMIETRYQFKAFIEADDGLTAPDYRLRREADGEVQESGPQQRRPQPAPESEQREERGDKQGRRRGRRGGRKRGGDTEGMSPAQAAQASEAAAEVEEDEENREEERPAEARGGEDEDRSRKKRRRGKRGGRRRGKRQGGEQLTDEQKAAEPPATEGEREAQDDDQAEPAAPVTQEAPAEPPQTGEAETPAEKPKARSRRGRGRKKAEAKPEAAAEAAEAESVSEAAAEQPASEEKPKAEAEAKPKRRGRGRPKKAEAEGAAEQESVPPAPKAEEARPEAPKAEERQPSPESGEEARPSAVVIDVDQAKDRPKKKGWWSKMGL